MGVSRSPNLGYAAQNTEDGGMLTILSSGNQLKIKLFLAAR